MIVLGIESSCDEMAVAVVEDGVKILSNVIASQASLHEKTHGVFPETAAREHIHLFLPAIREALREANLSPEAIDKIAVANGPGLIGSLLIGVNVAKSLALAWNKPLVGVNHVEAHLYAAMMRETPLFPSIGLVISGGHTLLLRIPEIGVYETIGTTVDDAVGEAFDKVATLLGLPYPGGPAIEALAKEGDPSRYLFKPGRVKNQSWNFSFSGLKTQVLYALKGQNGSKEALTLLPVSEKSHLAASFQETALKNLVSKVEEALSHFPSKAVYIGGGVSNNERLRLLFSQANLPVPLYFPGKNLSLDNAAMIAGLGFFVPVEVQGQAPAAIKGQALGTIQGLDLEVCPTLHSLQSARQDAVFSRG